MKLSAITFALACLHAAALPLNAQAQGAANDWTSAVKAVEPQVIAWRRQIHQHPELGNSEVETAKLVASQLRKFGIEVRTGVAKTGVVGVLKGGLPGPVVALRADMDALPAKETTGLPFASKAKGIFHGKEVDVMHACGHDAHTAILLGAAKVLADRRAQVPGTVVFIFQPAEEGAADVDDFAANKISYGARRMVEEGVLDKPKVEAVFGLHVIAGIPAGHIHYKPGTALNSSDGFRITITGKQTHGSMPWAGSDPVVASAQVINAMQTLVSRRANLSSGMGVVSVGSIHAGTAGNVIPNDLTMEGTIRSNASSIRNGLVKSLPPLVENTATALDTQAKVQLAELMPITMNDKALTEAMLPALQRAADGKVTLLETNLAASEDFAYYAQKVPGLYVFLGATPPDQDMNTVANNHNPGFIVDETDAGYRGALACGVCAGVCAGGGEGAGGWADEEAGLIGCTPPFKMGGLPPPMNLLDSRHGCADREPGSRVG